jgi:hypothetical protein
MSGALHPEYDRVVRQCPLLGVVSYKKLLTMVKMKANYVCFFRKILGICPQVNFNAHFGHMSIMFCKKTPALLQASGLNLFVIYIWVRASIILRTYVMHIKNKPFFRKQC